MSKIIKIFTTALFCISAVVKADLQFKPNIVASTQDANMQWWFNLPANSVPKVLTIKQLYYNQGFSLFSFFDKADIKDNNFDILYSIVSIRPDKIRSDVAQNVEIKGRKPTKNIIVASTDSVGVKLDDTQPEGIYTFEIIATDKISNITSTNITRIQLSKWVAPEVLKGRKFIDDTIYNYYNNPSPDLLYSIFFSPDLDLSQPKSPNGLNYTYIGFFKAAFKRNMFLIDEILKDFDNMTSLNKSRTIFLLTILGEKEIDPSRLNESQIKYQESMRNATFANPYQSWDKTLGATQIDMLWGEFFADGTYTPIRRIIDLVALVDEANFTKEKMSTRQKPTPDEMRKFMLGAYQMVALKSILLYSKKFELVQKYCMWAIENKDIPKSTYVLLKGTAKN